MTVRAAELVMAVFLALVLHRLMYKSADGLKIGWIPGSGPGRARGPSGSLPACF